MHGQLLELHRIKPTVWLVLGVLVVGSFAVAATMLAALATKYLLMVFAASSFFLIFLLSGNPRLFLLYGLLFFGTLQVGKKVMGVEHVGGATGFDVTISDPFLLGLFALQIRDRVQGHRRSFRFPRIAVPWILLMGLGLIDVATENFRLPAAHEVWRMGRILLWMLVVTNEVVRRRQFMHVAVALILGAVFHALVAVTKDILGVQLGLENYGELSAAGITDLGKAALTGEIGVRRVSGLMGHPILLGAYLVMSLSIGFALLFAPIRLTLKAFIVVAITFGTVVVIMTLSRGAWMDFALVFIGVLVLTYAHPRARSRYFLVRSALVAGMLLLVFAFSGQIVARLFRAELHSVSSRWKFMATAVEMVKARPVFGFGLNNYVFDQYPYTALGTVNEMSKKWGDLSLWPIVHSTWMIVWSEQGTVGLILFLWMHVVTIRVGFRNLRLRDPTLNALNAGLLSAVLAVMADGMVSFLLRTPVSVIFFAIMALIMALDEWRRANELQPLTDPVEGVSAPQWNGLDAGPWLPIQPGERWLSDGAQSGDGPRLLERNR